MTAKVLEERGSWYERIANRCYSYTLPGIMDRMIHEAGSSDGGLINDLDTPIGPEIETVIAARIDQRPEGSEVPARTLLPAVMKRYSLNLNDFRDARADLRALEATCNACTRAGQCWKALRAGATRGACGALCPNAESLEVFAKTIGSSRTVVGSKARPV